MKFVIWMKYFDDNFFFYINFQYFDFNILKIRGKNQSLYIYNFLKLNNKCLLYYIGYICVYFVKIIVLL